MALNRFLEARSNRGKALLVHNNYDYSFEADSRTEEGIEYWRCPHRPPYCPGRAAVQSAWQVGEDGKRYKIGEVRGQHNHAAFLGGYVIRDVEGWHSVWNAHLNGTRLLSAFCRKMITEDDMWANRVDDYQAAPADGIRGAGQQRKAKYMRQDANLQALLAQFAQKDPLVYLRACANHLHFNLPQQ